MSERPQVAPTGAPDPGPGPSTVKQPERAQGADNAERLGAIVSTGLDLAESGLTVGLALVDRLGTLAQRVLDGVAAQRGQRDGMAPPGWRADAAAYPGPPPLHPAAPQPWASEAAASAPRPPAGPAPPAPPPIDQAAAYCIANRLPLYPGDSVQVSFSVNNDSALGPKRVALQVEGFVGETTGVQLDGASFRVEPGELSIAPMDFEKLVLVGRLPAGIPPDLYAGRVVIAAERTMQIAVRLAVSAAAPAAGGGAPGAAPPGATES